MPTLVMLNMAPSCPFQSPGSTSFALTSFMGNTGRPRRKETSISNYTATTTHSTWQPLHGDAAAAFTIAGIIEAGTSTGVAVHVLAEDQPTISAGHERRTWSDFAHRFTADDCKCISVRFLEVTA